MLVDYRHNKVNHSHKQVAFAPNESSDTKPEYHLKTGIGNKITNQLPHRESFMTHPVQILYNKPFTLFPCHNVNP